MGGAIGGIIGGIGSIVAANKQAEASREATQAALTGYNYLTTGPGGAAMQRYIAAGDSAVGGRAGALEGMAGTTNMQAQLLGAAPLGAGTQNAFNQYKNSTGYQFQLGEGQRAITSSAAARGMLNSGATARGLTELGQNLASTTFNNYLGQLGNVGTQQGNLAGRYGDVAQAGQNALGQIGSVGAASGGGAANAVIQGGNAQAAGIAGAATNFGSAINAGMNYFNQPKYPPAPTGGLY